MKAARALAEFCSGLSYAGLPAGVIRQVKRSLADYVAVNLAGTRAPTFPALVDLAAAMGGGQATIIGAGRRTSPFVAAVVNGAAAHHLELDDGHAAAHVHPGVTTIPAALAVAEASRLGGRQLLTAVAAGYEVCIRTGDAVTPAALYDRGFHVPALVGALGAAAACGVLMGFDAERLAGALGNCCLGPVAPFEPFRAGTAVKDLYGGWPAAAGLWAALLAQRGIVGPDSYLDGPRGFIRAVAGSEAPARLLNGLGRRWTLLGVYTKVHASCSHSHTTADAVLDLIRRRPLDPDDVDSVMIRTYSFACELNDPAPATPQGAKFSLPYVAAVAIARGRVSQGEFCDEALRDPVIRALARRVVVEEDPAYTAVHLEREDRRPVTVTVRLKSGETLEITRDVARGWPEQPLDDDELLDKFLALAGPVVSERAARVIWDLIQHVEDLADVRRLMDLLAGPVRAETATGTSWRD